jgi:glucose-1-phosphate thymidylyltransferase
MKSRSEAVGACVRTNRRGGASTDASPTFLCMGVKAVVVVEDASGQTIPASSGRPEALEHVANEPIAHHVLSVLESAGVEEVIVASSAELARDVRACLAMRGERAGARLRYVEQRAPLDLAAALNLAAPIVGAAPCIVHVATGLLGEPLEPLMDPVRGNSPDVGLIMHHGRASREEHLSPATLNMLNIAELNPERTALSMAGVCLFGPEALRHASKVPWRAGSDVDVTMVADRIRAAGGSFQVSPVNAWHRYAGDPLDLLELNRIALDRLEGQQLYPASNNGNRIEGRVCVHEQASVCGSVIVGPAVIGADAQVADSYIGPYTSIGARARIEGVEIERSIVSAGASIMHVGGRLAASVVGRDARIFRDFSLPRAMRLRVGDGTEVALC